MKHKEYEYETTDLPREYKTMEERIKSIEDNLRNAMFKKEFWVGGVTFTAILILSFVIVGRIQFFPKVEIQIPGAFECVEWNLVSHCVNKKSLNISETFLPSVNVYDRIEKTYKKETDICFFEKVNCTKSVLVKVESTTIE